MGNEVNAQEPTVHAVRTEAAPQAIGPYSAGIKTSGGGGFIFVSGQLPLDPSSGQMVDGDVTALVRRALANGLAIVEAAGSSLEQIVKVTVFLTNLEDFGVVNDAYAEFFGDWRPARSVVEVSRLPRNSPIEIEMIAIATQAQHRQVSG